MHQLIQNYSHCWVKRLIICFLVFIYIDVAPSEAKAEDLGSGDGTLKEGISDEDSGLISFEFDSSLNALLNQGSSEPTVSCPAGYTQLGGLYYDKVKSDYVRRYDVTASAPGELLLTGGAMEGHPDLGCSPAGDTPFEPHDNCSQAQQDETFSVKLSGNLGTYDLGTYDDKRDSSKENWWFDAGTYSKNVMPGPYTFELRHVVGNSDSVTFKLVACFRPMLSQPTETPSPTLTATAIPTEVPDTTGTATPTPTDTPETPVTVTATPTGTPTNTPESTETPTTTPTDIPPQPPDPSCNGYQISGYANDPDSPGAPIRVNISIDGAFIATVYSSGTRFSYPIPDNFKDDELHNVGITWDNPYSSTYISGYDEFKNPIYSTVNDPTSAYLDYTSFRCPPPESDLFINGDAWAKTPGRGGAYPNGDSADDKIWLEDSAVFEVIVGNNHLIFPALDVEVTVELPEDPQLVLDWGTLWFNPAWTCNPVSVARTITCTIDRLEKAGPSGPVNIELIKGESIVPGTYRPDTKSMDWKGEIKSNNLTAVELTPLDNETDFELEVIKSWFQTVPYTKLINQYNHVRYHDYISDQLNGEEADNTFGSGELIPSIFQIPVHEMPGITMTNYTTLTVEFCTIFSEMNCSNPSAIITGAVRINSYELTETIPQRVVGGSVEDDPLGSDLQAGPMSFTYGSTGFGRFVDQDPANCEIWIDKMKPYGGEGDCVAPPEIVKDFSATEQGLYEWADSEIFGLLLVSAGGRAPDCGLPASGCLEVNGSMPSIYKTTGIINYEVIFYDDDHERIGDSPISYFDTLLFTIFNQQLTLFDEVNNVP